MVWKNNVAIKTIFKGSLKHVSKMKKLTQTEISCKKSLIYLRKKKTFLLSRTSEFGDTRKLKLTLSKDFRVYATQRSQKKCNKLQNFH